MVEGGFGFGGEGRSQIGEVKGSLSFVGQDRGESGEYVAWVEVGDCV